MKKIAFYCFISICSCFGLSATEYCLTEGNQQAVINSQRMSSPSIGKQKTVRVNVHFMLKSDGTGNFREADDGNGNTTYNGYLYAYDLVDWMNSESSWNQAMRIPVGNTTPVLPKNYNMVLDAVYFWKNNATYNYNTISYATQGKDKDSVVNIFLSNHASYGGSVGGYASNLNPYSKIKYTENRGYWQRYLENVVNSYPFSWFMHATGNNTLHELGHLYGLSHTIRWNNAPPCPTGCTTVGNKGYGTINVLCDDGCSDTPTAWEITTSGGCANHPACGWDAGTHCSNNLMDYSGANALTPCQIGIIHSSLEDGMKSYLSCEAVINDLDLCDIGYPKTSYFGKTVKVGCTSTMADVSNSERISVYFADYVELNNFEVSTNSSFEVFFQETCQF